MRRCAGPVLTAYGFGLAVEQIFGVKVVDVRVANYRGKMKRIPSRREMGRRPDWKKAFVTLKSGEKPIMYEDAI